VPHRRIQELIQRSLALILAGGEGQRLHPLTRDRAKPAVPFGGHYRIIDFTLSNCLNSGIRRIHVLTQYKSLSLDRHLHLGWSVFNRELGEFLDIIPPQQRTASRFYMGTADAVFQNVYTLERERPDRVLVLMGDHVYKMDYVDMLRFHVEREADLTIACVPLPREKAGLLGIVEKDDEARVTGFAEKPVTPAPIPGRPGMTLVSMGVYIFETDVLERKVAEDAERTDSSHDFARDVIPSMIGRDRVFAYPFREPFAETDEPYWRDIGTVDAYYEANMDLVAVTPRFNLYDESWPVRTYQEQRAPAKFVFAETGGRVGAAVNSLVAAGCIVSGGWVEHSLLSYGVFVHSHSRVVDSILLEDVDVARKAMVRRAIVDKGVKIPEGEKIGVDLERDRERFTVSPNGVVVVPKEMRL
jgi:glucose-1-phosphate adenylyltransferase